VETNPTPNTNKSGPAADRREDPAGAAVLTVYMILLSVYTKNRAILRIAFCNGVANCNSWTDFVRFGAGTNCSWPKNIFSDFSLDY